MSQSAEDAVKHIKFIVGEWVAGRLESYRAMCDIQVEVSKVSIEDNEARPATKEQIKFGMAIASKLNINLPDKKTRQSMFLFIKEHVNEFYKKKQESDSATEPTIYDYEPDEDEADCLGIDVYTGALND